jgi:hypothetical protein
LLVRPSRRVLEAAFAAFADVCRLGVPVWERALPLAVLDFDPVDLFLSTEEALPAAFFPVVFLFTGHLLSKRLSNA